MQENFRFYYAAVISIHLNCQLGLITKLEMMHTLQAQVCGCVSAHPGLKHQKMKQEAGDASKRP